MGDPGTAVSVDGLVKRYGSAVAVNGISFEVRRGEVFALLGPNGAGKTTTIEILEGYRSPTSGRVSVLGLDPGKDGTGLKQRVGVMLQENGLYLTITPKEALRLWSRFYTRPRDPDELLVLVGLHDAADTRYRRLSGGQKRRLALALALTGTPEILFLDEPTAGLDPQARRTAWDLIRSLQAEGVTILLATHYLEEAQRLADRVAIIRGGSLAAYGELDVLLQGDESVRVRTDTPVSADLFTSIPSVLQVRGEPDGVTVLGTARPRDTVAELAARLRDAGITPREIAVGHRSLEDLFFDLTSTEEST